MNDQVLPDAGETVPAGQPAPAAAPVAGATPDRLDRLENAMAELAATVRDAAAAVKGIPGPAPAPVEPVEKFLERFSADPQGTLNQVADARVAQAVAGQVTPAMRTMLEATSRQLLAAHRADIDIRFGAGTYDELFKPQLEQDMTQLLTAAPGAAANSETVEALVNRLYGTHFAALREREKAMETARSRGVSHLVPGGGVPRVRTLTGDELPDDVEQHLRNWEKHTGEMIDRKHFSKLYYSGEESGPGKHRTNVAQYLQAIGADADTKKTYLGERQA